MRIFAVGLLGSVFAGCATIRPEPTSLDHGLLIVRARVRGAVLPFTADQADGAKAALLGTDGEPVPGKVAATTFSGQGAVVFFDMPPGRYVLREITFKARGARYVVTIPGPMAQGNAVELRPGKAAFLGELSLSGVYPEFDVAVERALAVVAHWIFPWTWTRRPLITRDAELHGFDTGAEAEIRALRAARPALEGSQWGRLLTERLREMSAPAPVKTEGLLNRPIPLHSEAMFSWRDTLGWGEPERTASGAVWRNPKSSARVVVFFTSSTAAGFRGYDAAVRDLRVSAGSIEDPAATYEVRVATRIGAGARSTSYRYPERTLVGSEQRVIVTETVLVDAPQGLYTARLRAERGEFEKTLPAFREFLTQLVLGAPVKVQPKSEVYIPTL